MVIGLKSYPRAHSEKDGCPQAKRRITDASSNGIVLQIDNAIALFANTSSRFPLMGEG